MAEKDIPMTIKISRDEAISEFENVTWNDDNPTPTETIEKLRRATLMKIDAEIQWYAKHAGFHWRGFKCYSYALRFLAIFFVFISTLLLEIATFHSTPSAVPFLWRYGIDRHEIPFLSVALLLFAGFFVLLDKHFMITKGMARFRSAEYSLRVLRAECEAELIQHIQELPTPCTKVDFNTLRAVAAKRYVDIIREIKTETIGWSDDLKENMNSLMEEIIRLKASVREKAVKLEREIAEEFQKFPLTIKVAAASDRNGKQFSVHARNTQTEHPAIIDHTFAPGESWTALLPSGSYLFELWDGEGSAITNKYAAVGKAGAEAEPQELTL